MTYPVDQELVDELNGLRKLAPMSDVLDFAIKRTINRINSLRSECLASSGSAKSVVNVCEGAGIPTRFGPGPDACPRDLADPVRDLVAQRAELLAALKEVDEDFRVMRDLQTPRVVAEYSALVDELAAIRSRRSAAIAKTLVNQTEADTSSSKPDLSLCGEVPSLTEEGEPK